MASPVVWWDMTTLILSHIVYIGTLVAVLWVSISYAKDDWGHRGKKK